MIYSISIIFIIVCIILAYFSPEFLQLPPPLNYPPPASSSTSYILPLPFAHLCFLHLSLRLTPSHPHPHPHLSSPTSSSPSSSPSSSSRSSPPSSPPNNLFLSTLPHLVEIVLQLPKQETSRQHQRSCQNGAEDRTGADAQKHRRGPEAPHPSTTMFSCSKLVTFC